MSIRLANVHGRSSLICGDRSVDVAKRSNGAFSTDPMDALTRWAEFRSWAETIDAADGDAPVDAGDLIFTGTPAGVGSTRRRYLAAGELIESEIEQIGSLRNHCVAGPEA